MKLMFFYAVCKATNGMDIWKTFTMRQGLPRSPSKVIDDRDVVTADRDR